MSSTRTLRRSALLSFAAAVAAALVAGPALADADPASDVLYGQTVFYSFTPPSEAAQERLQDVVTKANKAGYPIRVALIGKPADLGGVGALWAKPREYARFLGLELRFFYKGPLLVVMPDGLGYARDGKKSAAADATLRRVRIQGGRDGLADTAVEGIARLAAAAGHPIAVPPKGGSSEGSSGRNRLIILLGGLMILTVGAAVYVLLRRGDGEADEAA